MRDKTAFFKNLKGHHMNEGNYLFSATTKARTRFNGLKLQKVRFQLNYQKNIVTIGMICQLNQLLREVVGPPMLAFFNPINKQNLELSFQTVTIQQQWTHCTSIHALDMIYLPLTKPSIPAFPGISRLFLAMVHFEKGRLEILVERTDGAFLQALSF